MLLFPFLPVFRTSFPFTSFFRFLKFEAFTKRSTLFVPLSGTSTTKYQNHRAIRPTILFALETAFGIFKKITKL